ncbi:MAG: SocA family protein [Treponema sp.]|nr:SocA family protein [Treponema sp.]
MKAYHNEILENSLAYICEEYFFKKHEYIPQLIMFKILALFDFQMVRETGVPTTELRYYAYDNGPVPKELYDNWEDKEKVVRFDDVTQKTCFKSIKPADTDYLSEDELNCLNTIIDRAVVENWDKKKASEISHKEIRAWAIARSRGLESEILFKDEFENFDSKSESEMTLPEKHLLHYNYLESMNA